MRYIKILFLVSIVCGNVVAQNPAPAPPQSQPVLIKGATIHTGTGEVIENGMLLFNEGKIVQVGTSVSELPNTLVIDASGKHIYPGLIAPNTNIGLSEIEAVRATRDFNEVGEINPNARSIIAYNTDSKVTPTVRSNGILLAQIVPTGGLICGTSSVVELDAWNWEDAAYKTDDAVYMNWPQMTIYNAWWAPPKEEQEKQMQKSMDELKKAFDDARAYWQAKNSPNGVKEIDQRWEALIPVFEKKRPLFIRAINIKQIVATVDFSKTQNVNIVLVGGLDSWMCTKLLADNNIPVVLGETHLLPARDDEDIDIAYKLPKILKDAGVRFCLSVGGFWQQRNLPFMAGTAAAYGLTKEEALQAVTKNTAEILGIADRVGTLEAGKDASLIVTDGDILDMKSSNVKWAFIRGRQINLDNIQKQLASKYAAKYGIQIGIEK